MGITILIIAFKESTYQNGSIGLAGEWYARAQKMFPEISQLNPGNIDGAIGIFAKKEHNHLPAKRLKVKELKTGTNSAYLSFAIQSDLEFTSNALRKRAQNLLKRSGQWNGEGYLPIWCLLTAEQASILLSKDLLDLGDELEELQRNNDWLGIYRKVAPINLLAQNHAEIWDNPEILSIIGFACGKLSETSGIPQNIFRDEAKKREYLKQQEQYRRESELLRKRCIELAPGNPRYISNLAYFHYQNVQELSQPRGRRDGNIREEVDWALKYLDQALEIDPNRLNDLYRKGYLLTQILPKQILFGRSVDGEDDRPTLANQTRIQGIDCFQQVIRIWEQLQEDSEQKKRNRKEYIKSLYYIGQAHYDLIRNVWDEAVYLLDLKSQSPIRPGYNPQDLENANKAWEYFYKCWQVDNPLPIKLNEENMSATPPSGVEEGVHKLYWLGKTAFVQYWILSGYGQCDTEEAGLYRERAIKFLDVALRLGWSPEVQNQRKDFIAEMLARVYISQGQPDKAVQVIEQNTRNIREAYIQHALGMGLIMTRQYSKAQNILSEAMENKANRDPWTTAFLTACNYLEQEKLDEAQNEFSRAQQIAQKQGKTNIDSLMIGNAFIAYKSQDRPKGINYLKQALTINPYRLAVQKRLENWQQQETKTKTSPLPD